MKLTAMACVPLMFPNMRATRENVVNPMEAVIMERTMKYRLYELASVLSMVSHVSLGGLKVDFDQADLRQRDPE
jgi:hypothetical protein